MELLFLNCFINPYYQELVEHIIYQKIKSFFWAQENPFPLLDLEKEKYNDKLEGLYCWRCYNE